MRRSLDATCFCRWWPNAWPGETQTPGGLPAWGVKPRRVQSPTFGGVRRGQARRQGRHNGRDTGQRRRNGANGRATPWDLKRENRPVGTVRRAAGPANLTGSHDMPMLPKRGCCEPGCGAVAEPDSSRCPTHQPAVQRSYDDRRGTAAERDYDGDHRRLRVLCFERDGWCCYICGRETPRTARGKRWACAPEMDHIVAMANGGSHTYSNVACCCRACNNKKAARDLSLPLPILTQA